MGVLTIVGTSQPNEERALIPLNAPLSIRCVLSYQVRSLDRTSARNQVKYQDDHSYDQDDVNQATTNVEAKPQQPQDHQDHNNCPQHFFHPSSSSLSIAARKTTEARREKQAKTPPHPKLD